MTSLTGRRVLVTGASSGIGAATAAAIVHAGGRVALAARHPERLHEVAGPLGDGAHVEPFDVADPDATAGAMARILDVFGGLDAVVNAAGVLRLGGMATTGPDDWRATFDVNVLGLLHVVHAALPLLRASDGPADVVNVSSMSGRRRASVEMTVYSASKFAVHVISDGLREELAPEGIRVTTVSPGFVRTPILRDVADGDLRASFQEKLDTMGLEPEAVADQIVHALAQPPGVDLFEIAVMSTRQ